MNKSKVKIFSLIMTAFLLSGCGKIASSSLLKDNDEENGITEKQWNNLFKIPNFTLVVEIGLTIVDENLNIIDLSLENNFQYLKVFDGKLFSYIPDTNEYNFVDYVDDFDILNTYIGALSEFNYVSRLEYKTNKIKKTLYEDMWWEYIKIVTLNEDFSFNRIEYVVTDLPRIEDNLINYPKCISMIDVGTTK